MLVLDNVVRIRTACAHNEPELVNSLSSISRSDPGAINASSSNSSERVKILPSYHFRGKPYYGEAPARARTHSSESQQSFGSDAHSASGVSG